MIEKDMLSKKVVNYQLKDEVVTNPKEIKVGANEVVYICYCLIESTDDFKIQLESGTDLITYHEKNTTKQLLSSITAYHSSQITSHWSNIKIKSKVSQYFFLRYIRITLQKNQSHEES
jgi:hypothetical protein